MKNKLPNQSWVAAVAPELLQALKVTLTELRAMHETHCSNCTGGCPFCEIRDRAVAVINKAEGTIPNYRVLVEIKTGIAFGGDISSDTARLLRVIADRMEDGSWSVPSLASDGAAGLYDAVGVRVGTITVRPLVESEATP